MFIIIFRSEGDESYIGNDSGSTNMHKVRFVILPPDTLHNGLRSAALSVADNGCYRKEARTSTTRIKYGFAKAHGPVAGTLVSPFYKIRLA